MLTLDYWEGKLTSIPTTIMCPKMEIIKEHHNVPIFTGSGQIDVKSLTEINFMIHAIPFDNIKALRILDQFHKNSYDLFTRLYLNATDYQGTEWNCGVPLFINNNHANYGCMLSGNINSLGTTMCNDWVSKESGVELVYYPKFSLPMSEKMITVTQISDDEIQKKFEDGRQTINILNSKFSFFNRPSGESLWVTANTSDKLPHPHLENWISEPFNILLGQLVFPYLVARNFGDGSAQVSVRPLNNVKEGITFVSLLDRAPIFIREKFWKLYSDLIKLFAQATDEHGEPNFKQHPLTRFYQEIIQAAKGSKWILCMTLSSAVEGIVRLLLPETKNPKVTNYLKKLVTHGDLKDENEKAWTKVRNEVLHGRLVSPWATEEEDNQIKNLMDLVHRLTRLYIKKEIGD